MHATDVLYFDANFLKAELLFFFFGILQNWHFSQPEIRTVIRTWLYIRAEFKLKS
jgi:hypothetical protein